jgi:pyruvate dehydrogenase E1 component alpha subunit
MDLSETRSVPGTVSVLRSDGSADPSLDPRIGVARATAIYEAMVTARLAGDRLAAEDSLGFFPRAYGDEAAVVGACAALRDQDWIFPTHGDYGAALFRGLSIETLVYRAFGGALDPLRGHDHAAGLSARAQRIGSASAPAATHLPHAVGLAWAARQRGEDVVAIALFDGAEVSAADFHTGVNFAGVMRAPAVFVCKRHEGEESAADHAIEYGVFGERCDGSDALAVVRAVSDAAERARRGEGASIVDLVIGEPALALARMRAYLERLAAWDEARERALSQRVGDALSSAVSSARSAGAPPLDALHEHVFARLTSSMQTQREELARAPRPR